MVNLLNNLFHSVIHIHLISFTEQVSTPRNFKSERDHLPDGGESLGRGKATDDDETHQCSQRLIRKQFPDIGGLYCPSVGATASYPKKKSKRWLQIVHDGNRHWVLTARGFTKNSKEEDNAREKVTDENTDGRITVYDSLNFHPERRKHVVACISAICRSDRPKLTYFVNGTEKQTNSYDCGVYAIAFATSLVFGEECHPLNTMPTRSGDI